VVRATPRRWGVCNVLVVADVPRSCETYEAVNT